MKRLRTLFVMGIVACLTIVGLAGCSNQASSAPDSSSAEQTQESSASSTAESSTAAESKSPSSAATPHRISAHDIAISNVKMELEPDGNERGGGYYVVTGTITNNSTLDLGEAEISLVGTVHDVDSYGDETEELSYQYYTSVTPGLIYDTLYSLKAGESRDFTLGFTNIYTITDPIVTVESVSGDSSLGSKLGLAGDFNVTVEKDAAGFKTVMVENNTGEYVTSATLRYAIFDDNEWNVIEEDLYRPLWSDTKHEIPRYASKDEDFSSFIFLDMRYKVDPTATSSKLSDSFAWEVTPEGICKLTNNTGKYLSNVNVYYSYINSSGERVIPSSKGYRSLKPGETYDIELDGGLEARVFDIDYTVDSSK